MLGAVRTPLGRHGGALASVRPDDLAARALEALVGRAGVPAAEVADVYLGCANQAGEDNRNVARMALLLAGFPVSVPGCTVNRLCGSGLEAVAQAARALLAGEGHLYVAGGVESMSRAPFALAKPERAFPRGAARLEDTALGWRFVNPRLEALGHTDALGVTAEALARRFDLSREAQDRFALGSHARALAAAGAGRFGAELVPVEAAAGRVEADEGPRPGGTLAALARLAPAFAPGGTVTAGNSSPLSDGAAALLLGSAEYARAHGLRPLARLSATAVAGVAPAEMGLGPVPAAARALARAGLGLGDLGRIELNEAFAAQALAVCREWGLDPADPRLNPDGGAIALGHPLGCSGARLAVTAAQALARSPTGPALVALCVGVGQGIAAVLEPA
ncbi:acetyl-CoA acetyltransferase [Anaeromyxobacter paludicola]|uniref:acetyl-CoA C-acyltransferase n=1 Tax=Anaeromyxobacter paludicola TaxID=2918171 RepID=A0ABM7XFN6_9BACT|nr:acetyl-CoA acetyltransferase [Anaeromyxobacter paludicola]